MKIKYKSGHILLFFEDRYKKKLSFTTMHGVFWLFHGDWSVHKRRESQGRQNQGRWVYRTNRVSLKVVYSPWYILLLYRIETWNIIML